jgi:hypothetical protein
MSNYPSNAIRVHICALGDNEINKSEINNILKEYMKPLNFAESNDKKNIYGFSLCVSDEICQMLINYSRDSKDTYGYISMSKSDSESSEYAFRFSK